MAETQEKGPNERELRRKLRRPPRGRGLGDDHWWLAAERTLEAVRAPRRHLGPGPPQAERRPAHRCAGGLLACGPAGMLARTNVR